MTTATRTGAAILATFVAVGVSGPASAAASAHSARPMWVARDDMIDESFALSPDGATAYVAGWTSGIQVVAHDAVTGAKEWVAKTPGGSAADVAVSPDGSRVFVTGGMFVDPPTENYVTAALDAHTGSLLWDARYSPGPGQSAGGANMGVTADASRVYVTGPFEGISGGSNDHWDFGTVAYDQITGHLDWVARYNGPGGDSNDLDYGAISLSPDGTLLYVTGTSEPTAACGDYATVAYATTDGAQAWAVTDDAGGCDIGWALAPSPDGAYLYVTGYNFSALHDRTFALDAHTGEQLASADSLYGAPDIAVAPDGSRVYVTGTTTFAYDATLSPIWSASMPHFGAGSVAVSPDGARVYVAGSVDNGRFCSGYPSNDYATVAFDAATGTRLWRARYSGLDRNSPDAAHDVATSPDGSSLFVSGQSDTCTADDVATLAYRT